VLEKKPSGHLKEHRAARWMERMKRIFAMRMGGMGDADGDSRLTAGAINKRFF